MLDISLLYALGCCVIILVLSKKWKKPALPYPPGPKGYPILGNVFDLPLDAPIWETLTSLANRQGGTDILYLRLIGKDMVVLSSNEIISELIDKRSGIYADRPHSTMLKLSGLPEWAFSVMPYGSRWRTHRKLFHEALNVRSTVNFEEYQTKHSHRFLLHLLDAPERFLQEIEFMTGAVIMSATYGIDTGPIGNPFLHGVLEALDELGEALVLGKSLVDVIPILQYVPDWFPGTSFKALAKEGGEKLKKSAEGPMEYVKNAMKSGQVFPRSIVSDCLSRLEDQGETWFDEEDIQCVSGVVFAGGAETTRTLLQSFFLAMVLNPRAMGKAQEELDRVIGQDRLPDFSDKGDLPYVDAIVKETLRWNPPGPIGFPSRVTRDDVYRGYLIPAGATIVQNIWAVFRDPDTYPDPETFNPDRFLKDGKINPLVFNPELRVFGAGRRICPGREFALRTTYIVVACVLSVFNIEPTLNDDGSPQIPKAEFKNGLVRSPKPFKCMIRPRSEDAIKLIRDASGRTSC